MIFLHLLVILLVVTASGWGLLHLFEGRRTDGLVPGRGLVIPVVGYAAAIVGNWYSYLWLGSVSKGLLFFHFAALVVLIAAHQLGRRRFSSARVALRLWYGENRWPIVAALSTTAIAAAPYMLAGEGNYYHSGNADLVVDGVGGAIAFLGGSVEEVIQSGSGGYVDQVHLQYSSGATWSRLLGVEPLDGILLQGLLNLYLTVLAVFWMCRYSLGMPRGLSVAAGATSVVMNLYFSTWLAGHVGSVMYGSVVPVMVGTSLLVIRQELRVHWVLVVGLLFVFLRGAYGPASNFVLPPLLAYGAVVHMPRSVTERLARWTGWHPGNSTRGLRLGLTLVVAGCLTVAGILMFRWFFEGEHVFATMVRSEVAWRISLTGMMGPLYWGLLPSPVVGQGAQYAVWGAFPMVRYALYGASALLAFLMLVGVVRCLRQPALAFVGIFFLYYVPLLVSIGLFWGSSYYFYKSLAINIYMVVAVWCGSMVAAGFLVRGLYSAVLCVLLAINLSWDVYTARDIGLRPYNRPANMRELLSVLDEVGRPAVYLDGFGDAAVWAIRYALIRAGTTVADRREEAEVLLRPPNVRHVVDLPGAYVIRETALAQVTRLPEADDIGLSTGRYRSPDTIGERQIYWVGNNRSPYFDRMVAMSTGVVSFLVERQIAAQAWIAYRGIVPEADRTFSVPRALWQVVDSLGVQLSATPNEARYFVRFRPLPFTRGPGLYVPYEPVPGELESASSEKIIYQNQMFEVADLGAPSAQPSQTPYDVEKRLARPQAHQIDGNVSVALFNLTTEAQFLRLLIEPGPSINSHPFRLQVTVAGDEVAGVHAVGSALDFVDVPLRALIMRHGKDLSLTLSAENLTGRALLPLEERILNYAIHHVELASDTTRISRAALGALNAGFGAFVPFGEIDPQDIPIEAESGAWFGPGWYREEVFGGELFRWSEGDAALVFDSSEVGRRVRLHVEPVAAGMEIVATCAGDTLATRVLDGRTTFEFDLPAHAAGVDQIRVRLRIQGERASAEDGRLLGFRAFALEVTE